MDGGGSDHSRPIAERHGSNECGSIVEDMLPVENFSVPCGGVGFSIEPEGFWLPFQGHSVAGLNPLGGGVSAAEL